MLVFALTATLNGLSKRSVALVLRAFTVASTVLVLPSRTDVVLSPVLVTYTMFVFGLTATATGSLPTVTLDTTLLVLPSITETVLSPVLVTYIMFVFGLT